MIARSLVLSMLIATWLIPTGCRSKNPSMRVQTQPTRPASESPTASNASTQALSADLVKAARNGDIENVRNLLERGADVNTMKYGAHPPLHAAASAGHLEMVKFLLDQGAEINKRSGKNRTPVWEAAFNDRDDVVAFLKSQGGVK